MSRPYNMSLWMSILVGRCQLFMEVVGVVCVGGGAMMKGWCAMFNGCW